MKVLLAIPICLSFLQSVCANAQVLPDDAVVAGKTIGEWSAEYWKWVLPLSANQNPMLDTTGASAAVGQPGGDVFLVAGVLALSPDTATRSFPVSEDVFFFPADVIANITVVPVALSVRVENLIATLAASSLPRKSQRPLVATLGGAEESFERGHVQAGIGQLRAFQNKVRHQMAPIDPALANQIIQAEQNIMDRASPEPQNKHNDWNPHP